MKLTEIQDLIKFVARAGVTEVEIEQKEFKITIKSEMPRGRGKKDEPMTVKVGDTVLYGKYSGTELSLSDQDYMIMRESDILAVL